MDRTLYNLICNTAKSGNASLTLMQTLDAGAAEECLQQAAEYGNIPLLAQTLECFPRFKNTDVLCFAINEAAGHGHLDALKFLFEHRRMDWVFSSAVEKAARRGHVECVRFLLNFSDPREGQSRALRNACLAQQWECARLLIPVSDPKADDSYALQYAVLHNNTNMIDLLYPLSDPQKALEALRDDYESEYWKPLEQRIEAERLNTVLHKEIDETTGLKVQRKM